MSINVAVTGYFGSGSSAVIDLLREYNCVSIPPYQNRSYEHNLFYISGGLFDLFSSLSTGNAPFTSDTAINNFISAMQRQYNCNFGWFGSYKGLVGDEFEKLYKEFIKEIADEKEGTSSNHEIGTSFSLIKLIGQIAAKLLFNRNHGPLGKKFIFDGNPVYFSMPTQDELIEATKKFTRGYFNLFDCGSVNVYDHLVWPQQIDFYSNCFEDSFKVIVVQRDPRDVFLLDKYVWNVPPIGHGKPHFPTNVNAFSDEWNRTVVRHYASKNVLQIQFEDLIYNYDDTVLTIESFLGLSDSCHDKKKCYFDPTQSIENTQVFNVKTEWKDEVSLFSGDIQDLFYAFPIDRTPNRKLMFEDPTQIQNGINNQALDEN